MLNLHENLVRVIAPEVGGGFGSKLDVYPEEALTAFAAMQLGQPVKWIESRMENFQATTHGRDHVQYVEMAARRDGTILGIRLRVLAEMGAYFQLLTPGIPTATPGMLPGVYAVPNIEGELIGVFTNKTPTGAYRGAGRPESTYLIERMVDLLASELQLDPAELRRRNFIAPDTFPHLTAAGNRYDSGNYALALDRALALAGYQELRQEQAKLRAQGRYMGIGLSTYVEICGAGPSRGESLGGWERGTVRIEPTCKVSVSTGTSPHGQGAETSLAQIVADELSVPLENVLVLHGDTATSPDGIGTFGSRGTAVGASAVLLSARKLRSKILAIAGHLLEADPDDLVLNNQAISVRGSPDRALSLQEIVKAAYRPAKIPREIEPGMEATTFFEPPDYTYPFGAHVAVVEVDPETGRISLRRFVAVDDCGRVINPMIVEGQIHGGLAQGISQALFEGAIYDESGQLLTGSLMEYVVPKASQLVAFETDRTETPTEVNPLGAKGAGEAGTIGSSPAIVNAVMDALAPFGIRHMDMPLTPEKVWQAIQASRQARGQAG
jgi:carbon-monoxide dehydrogenase large subunit